MNDAGLEVTQVSTATWIRRNMLVREVRPLVDVLVPYGEASVNQALKPHPRPTVARCLCRVWMLHHIWLRAIEFGLSFDTRRTASISL